MSELRGKRVLVTGAGQRVGAAIARRLGQDQAQVAVHFHRSVQGAQDTCRIITESGGQAKAFQADLGKRDEARGLVSRVAEAFGGLDLLVASAASYERVPFDAIDDRGWDATLALDLEAPFVLAHAARGLLRASRGGIVFITCTSPHKPYRNYLPYIVAKGALSHLMRVLALELAPEVRVNAVAPGAVLPPPDMSEEKLAAVVSEIPLARTGHAEDIAAAVHYLATAPYVTGHELVVDGGRGVGRLREPEGA